MSTTAAHSKILILDFGSQYTQVIARRIRECQVYSEVVPYNISAARVAESKPNGIVLSGGPASVYEERAPQIDPEIFALGIPALGICYGMQQIAHHLAGRSSSAHAGSTGRACCMWQTAPRFSTASASSSISGTATRQADRAPAGFPHCGAHRELARFAAIEHPQRKLYGLQFHPEVAHTPRGREIIQNFVYEICHCGMDWTMGSFIDEACEQVRASGGEEKVVLGLSGGVDSSVVAALLHKAIGDQLTCIFVNNGLLRAREEEIVQRVFGENFHIKLKYVDASERLPRRS
jgi:GMP synthase (glutamine-hydrolysing)